MKITFAKFSKKYMINLPQEATVVDEIEIRDFSTVDKIHCAMAWYYPTLKRIAIQLHDERVREILKEFTDYELTIF